MNILVANSYVGRGAGGQERVALDLAVGLSHRGHRVSILGPYSNCADLRARIPDTIKVFEEPWQNCSPGCESIARLLNSAHRIIRRERIEIVSGHGRMFGVSAACRVNQIPLVWTLHGAGGARASGRFNIKAAAVRALFKRIARGGPIRIVTVSEFTRNSFLDMVERPQSSDIRVILNGIGSLPLLSELPVPTFEGVVRLGYVGRIERHKGVFDLVPLCQRLTCLRVPFSLRIFGDGSAEQSLRQALSGFSPAASFSGYEGDVRRIYSSFDVLVHTARAEWLGTNLIESQAAARIPIAYSSGGNGEIIANSASGFTVPPSDIDGLAAAIESVYRNPALARRLASSARDNARYHFSLDRMCEDYEQMFRRVLRSTPPSASPDNN